MASTLISGRAEAGAALADPRFEVPAAPAVPPGEFATLAWLRASVSRFCEGAAHVRRRRIVEAELAQMDPSLLRRQAALAATAELAGRGPEPFNVMPLARRAPLGALAAELGMTDAAVVDAAVAAASGYLNPDQAVPDADDAVSILVQALTRAPAGRSGMTDRAEDQELIAARIGLLMQACDATAGLVGNALAGWLAASANSDSAGEATGPTQAADPGKAAGPGRATGPGKAAGPGRAAGPGKAADPGKAAGRTWSEQAARPAVDALIARALNEDPPVRRARRLNPAGEPVLIDITADPFGTGRRPCPGADHARALAAGVLDAVIPACAPASRPPVYPDSEALRIPSEVFVMLR